MSDRIWIWFADNGNIRKWQHEPFPEGTEYVVAAQADAELEEMTRSCLAERAGAASLRSKLEEAEGAHGSALVATPPAEGVVEALPPTREYVDRIVRIFRDRPADDTSAVVLQDYARATLAATPAVKDDETVITDAMVKAALAFAGMRTTYENREGMRAALAVKPAVKDDEPVVEAARGIASLLGNVEYKGGGANAAAMYADMLNDIRRFIRAALAAVDGRS